jgi:hypothetical protein
VIVYTWAQMDKLFDALLRRSKRFKRLEFNMTAVADYASRINDISNQNSEDIAAVAGELEDLKARVANVDADVAAQFDPILSKLQANADSLRALANPDSADNPAPVPSNDGGTA